MTFNVKDWETRTDAPFGVRVEPLRQVAQGLRFLGQHLGWSGDYFFPLTERNFERRLLMDSTFGNVTFSRAEHPYLGDVNLVFRGEEGLTNWVDWEGTNVVDLEDREFLFPGATTLEFQSGFSATLSRFLFKGSHIYLPDPFDIREVDYDPEIEYMETRQAWRAKIKEAGTLTLVNLARPGEAVEMEAVEWLPVDLFPLPERLDSWYGPWNSKGTRFTIEWMLTLLGVPGFNPAESLRLQPFTYTYYLEDFENFAFDEVLVDGEPLLGRKVKGVESITTAGSYRIRIRVEPEGPYTGNYSFSTVEIRTLNFQTNDPLLIDITEELLAAAPPEIGVASALNALETPSLYLVEPARAGELLADFNDGVGDDENAFIRLPFHVTRGGEHWNKAERVAHLFSTFGKARGEELRVQWPGEKVHFYEEIWDDWRVGRFFHEDYLVSLVREAPLGEEDGWTEASLIPITSRETGWVDSKVVGYDPAPSRGVNIAGWVGRYWERVGGRPLSGFLAQDLEQGKVIVARDNRHPALVPDLPEFWEEDTNIVKVCYCYFVAGFSAAGEPVF